MPRPNHHPLCLPTVQQQEVVFREFINIRRDRLYHPEQDYSHDYYCLCARSSCVVVLAVTDQDNYVLNEEYRHPAGKVLLGCAGGYMDGEEGPLEAAKRELLEETGYSADEFILLGQSYPYPGLSTQLSYFVLAKGAKQVGMAQREPAEVIQTGEYTIEQVEERIRTGCPVDGMLCAALYYHQLLCKRSI